MLRDVQPDLLFLAIVAVSMLFGFYFFFEGRARGKGRPMHIKLLVRRKRFYRLSPESYSVGGEFPYVALIESEQGEVIFVESQEEIPASFCINWKGDIVKMG